MNHDELRSIAHSAAASLASGVSFLVGLYELDVFAAARQSATGDVVVDFLRGRIDPAPVSAELAKGIAAFPADLAAFWQRHGTSVSTFNEMSARYWMSGDFLWDRAASLPAGRRPLNFAGRRRTA